MHTLSATGTCWDRGNDSIATSIVHALELHESKLLTASRLAMCHTAVSEQPALELTIIEVYRAGSKT